MFKNKLGALISLGVLVFVFLLQSLGILNDIENAVLDLKFNEFQRPVPHENVAIIYIDEQSLNSFQQQFNINWPWPRDVYGVLHNYLVSKGAKVVVYDIILDQPDFDRRVITGEQTDSLFSMILDTYQNGILAAQTSEGSNIKLNNKDFLLSPDIRLEDTLRYSISNIPTPLLLESAAGLGSVAVPSNGQSVIRSMPLFFSIGNDGLLPSLSVSAYMAMNDLDESDISMEYGKSISLGDNVIPIGNDFDFLINWYETVKELEYDSTHASFFGIFRAALEYSQLGYARADSLIDVQGKVVMIGANASGLSDIKSTPMSATKAMPGVEIHATLLNNLIDQDYVRTLPTPFKVSIILVLVLLIVFTILNTSFNVNIPLTLSIFIITIVAGLYFFGVQRYWLPTFEFVFVVFLSSFVTYSVKYAFESQQKKKIRGAFDLYVQKELVDEVLQNPEMLQLGGERRELTVLFSDLAGFTSISEQNEPEDLVSFLNLYLSEMTNIILNNKGTLDKYIGDAIMAFWGAPVPEEEHAYLACKSVIEMEAKLKELGDKLTISGMPFPLVRYGLNSGPMVVGNMGSKDRFSYTVMGDNVNLAARLEPANKIFGTQVLISEETQKQVKDHFTMRQVALLQVKGKLKPIKIFELIGEIGDENENLKKFLSIYNDALNFYLNRDWDQASDAFTKALELNSNDSICNLYIQEINRLKINPPGKDWLGVLEQKTK